MAVTSWRPSFTAYDLHGAFLFRPLPRSAVWEEALDGTDTLELVCEGDLSKGDRVVWMDARGAWHEHVVDGASRTHDASGTPLTRATCLNSICETWDDWVDDRRPSGSVGVALDAALQTTRWRAGNCDLEGSASAGLYHCSVREALASILETWGGELETEVEVGPSGVTERRVSVRAARGDQGSKKRFTWTKDLVSVSRTVGEENPKSRIYCYGRGEETESGGFGRRISIEDVNGGLPYVEDKAAEALWGRPAPGGGTMPAVGVYVNEQCEDPAQLKAEGLAYLERAKEPQVTYTCDAVDLARFGRPWEDMAVGDRVTVCDRGFSEEGVVLRGRIAGLRRDLLSGECTVTFGNLGEVLADAWAATVSRLASISKQSMAWNSASVAAPGWLEVLMGNLNAAYDAAGTYHHSSFEQGEIWSSVPLDDEGRATRPGGWAMNVNGLGFRLASGLKADGSWDWRAFGNGRGFTADEINAGTLNADLVRAGRLADTAGKNYWDLETGTFSLSQQAAFDGLTNGGKAKGIYMRDGELYIDASYIKTGTIAANLIQSIRSDGSHCSIGIKDGVITGYYDGVESGSIQVVQDRSYGVTGNQIRVKSTGANGGVVLDAANISVVDDAKGYAVTGTTVERSVIRDKYVENVTFDSDGTVTVRRQTPGKVNVVKGLVTSVTSG